MLFFILGAVGLILLVGGLVAGGTILNVAITRLTGKGNPTAPATSYGSDPHQQDKDTAWSSLWALFIIGTVAGLILIGISVNHFTEGNLNPSQEQPSFKQ